MLELKKDVTHFEFLEWFMSNLTRVDMEIGEFNGSAFVDVMEFPDGEYVPSNQVRELVNDLIHSHILSCPFIKDED